jgi:mannose-6-phosphate isomerase-like protein (cupin superfamily)
MGKTGHTLTNPVTGHSVTFLKTAEETGGELLQLEYAVARPEAPLKNIPIHIHAVSEERFEALAGSLGVIVGARRGRRVLQPGKEVLIPPGTPHTFWNAGQEELRFITDVRPAGQFQIYWETVFGLAADGQVNDKGLPSMWQVAVLVPGMDTYLPSVPVWLQKALIGGVLGRVGRLLGYGARYERYRGVA